MKLTPLIPDGYDGPIKRLACTLCRHIFYVARKDYDLLQPIAYCHECSCIVSAEIATALSPPSDPSLQVPAAPVTSHRESQPPTMTLFVRTIEQQAKEGRMRPGGWPSALTEREVIAFYKNRTQVVEEKTLGMSNAPASTPPAPFPAHADSGSAMLDVEQKQQRMETDERRQELDLSDKQSKNDRGGPISQQPPENGQEKASQYALLKKAIAGSYHRILLTNEAYGKSYISYGEWHRRLEEEIALVQAYQAVRPPRSNASQRCNVSCSQKEPQRNPPGGEE